MEAHEVTWEEYDQWALHLDKGRRARLRSPPTERDVIVDAISQPSEPYTSMDFGMGKPGRPAVSMTQFAAKVYCKWLSAKTGRYYRLPTEAEWEHACRAGQSTAYGFGDDASRLGEYAWFCDNSNDKYHKVAEKKPNPWGLYDMHGNVAEWVLDQYAVDAYSKRAGKPCHNPLVPATTEYDRVVRGGSWDDDAAGCRSAARRASKKDWKEHDPRLLTSIWYLTDASFLGFRVVRPLRMPTPEEAKKYEIDQQQLTQYKDYLKAQGKLQ
jgi:formylglycine-generating enzyme required for sulfatase activity